MTVLRVDYDFLEETFPFLRDLFSRKSTAFEVLLKHVKPRILLPHFVRALVGQHFYWI